MIALTDEYLAGFFDADGHVHFRIHADGRLYSIVIQVSQKTPGICEVFKKRFGGNINLCQPQDGASWYQWQVGHKGGALECLEVLIPYLWLKKAEAEMALDALKMRTLERARRAAPYTYLEKQFGLWFDLRFKELRELRQSGMDLET